MPPLRQVCEDVDARSKCNKCGHGDGGWSCSKSPCLQGVGMTTLLDMRGISKAFVGVKALSDVNFTVRQGEIHALVGENGAGKSTLMKVLSGVYPSGSYDGSIVYDGEERHFRDINDSEALGIIIIHQELALIPLLSIAENVFIASPPLLDLLLEFRSQGMSAILISHKLNEVARVADRITVLRDGRTVDTLDCKAGAVEEDRIIRKMVDRDLEHRFPKREPNIGDPVFRVENWSVYHPLHADRQVIKNVDFHVRRGEVVGIAGLMGAGRTEFAMSLFGRSWGRKITGRAMLHGREIDLSTVSRAIDAGLAYVTEDRKQFGLLLADDVRKNITLANLGSVAAGRVIDDIKEFRVASDYRNRMRIRCSDVYQTSGNLSGGNQQKVVLSKWLFTDPEILILDEPTRGIDIGAKYEIYCIINELADAGKAVIMISSEMPELLGICDRICVMNEGAFVGEFDRAEATQEKIMRVIVRRGERLVDRNPEEKLEEKLLGEV